MVLLLVLFFWTSFFTKNWVGFTKFYWSPPSKTKNGSSKKHKKNNIYEHIAHDFCGVIIVAKRTLKTETEVEETQRHFAGSPLVDQMFTPWYLDVPDRKLGSMVIGSVVYNPNIPQEVSKRLVSAWVITPRNTPSISRL